MAVVVLLAAIWAVVLVPPAVRAQRVRRQAFEVSFGRGPSPAASGNDAFEDAGGRGRGPATRQSPAVPRSPVVQRRRRIAGGLLTAAVATLVVGLLPTFRILLVVHLFVVDSFLFYVATLARRADRQARGNGSRAEARAAAAAAPRSRRRRPVVLADLPPAVSAR